MKSTGDILLVVLGWRQHLRSTSLENLAVSISNCIFVDPVRIIGRDRTRELVDERLSEILLGRRLSDPELGCAITHKNACSAAMSLLKDQDKIDWALFVEDDADLDSHTLKNIKSELAAFDSKFPSLVTYYSAGNCGSNRGMRNRNIKQPLSVSRHWSSGAVCYAVNLAGLIELFPFSVLPVDYVADWPVYYSRLKHFISNQIWVCEVEGHSSIGERYHQKNADRFMMHIRQLVNLRKLAKLYELPAYVVVRHLMITPFIRDASARFSATQLRLRKLIRESSF